VLAIEASAVAAGPSTVASTAVIGPEAVAVAGTAGVASAVMNSLLSSVSASESMGVTPEVSNHR
jgi:hypothetical protein